MNISFFVTNPKRMKTGHLGRVSTIIRGYQIANKIGAKINPKKDYENDVCVYVKPNIKPGNNYDFKGRSPYLDIIDGFRIRYLLLMRPEIPVIVCSQYDYQTYPKYVNNQLILIPQHHCNFENEKRDRQGISTIGIIGAPSAFELIPQELRQGITKRGLQLIEYTSNGNRGDVIEFYKKIDIQLVWRVLWDRKADPSRVGNPLKIVNAASFGIPTIALYEPAFLEAEDYCDQVNTVDEWLKKLDSLIKSPALYEDKEQRCLEWAKSYHIDKVCELYKELD